VDISQIANYDIYAFIVHTPFPVLMTSQEFRQINLIKADVITPRAGLRHSHLTASLNSLTTTLERAQIAEKIRWLTTTARE
jgi:hypothetical protein